MISPSNGRVVWFTPPTDDAVIVQHDKDKPLAALVVHVWGDRMVNLTVFDSDGSAHAVTSVTLLQDDDARPELGRFAEWMPFQKAQASKNDNDITSLRSDVEALKTALAEAPAPVVHTAPVDHEGIVETVFERIRAKLAGSE